MCVQAFYIRLPIVIRQTVSGFGYLIEIEEEARAKEAAVLVCARRNGLMDWRFAVKLLIAVAVMNTVYVAALVLWYAT